MAHLPADVLMKWHDLDVCELDFSVRASNCLKNNNIRIVGDLVVKTEEELLSLRNFGVRTLSEVTGALHSVGLHMGMKSFETDGPLVEEFDGATQLGGTSDPTHDSQMVQPAGEHRASSQMARTTSPPTMQTLVDEILLRLNERARDVIELRFGLRDAKPQTLEDIGALRRVTRELIRQIEYQALQNGATDHDLTTLRAFSGEVVRF